MVWECFVYFVLILDCNHQVYFFISSDCWTLLKHMEVYALVFFFEWNSNSISNYYITKKKDLFSLAKSAHVASLHVVIFTGWRAIAGEY